MFILVKKGEKMRTLSLFRVQRRSFGTGQMPNVRGKEQRVDPVAGGHRTGFAPKTPWKENNETDWGTFYEQVAPDPWHWTKMLSTVAVLAAALEWTFRVVTPPIESK